MQFAMRTDEDKAAGVSGRRRFPYIPSKLEAFVSGSAR